MKELMEHLSPELREGATIINHETDGAPYYIQLADGRALKPWPYGREEFEPYCVHSCGGRPYVVASRFEVSAGGGWDLPTLLILELDGKTINSICRDFDLISETDRKMLLEKYSPDNYFARKKFKQLREALSERPELKRVGDIFEAFSPCFFADAPDGRSFCIHFNTDDKSVSLEFDNTILVIEDIIDWKKMLDDIIETVKA